MPKNSESSRQPLALVCSPKRLPRDRWIKAAQTAVNINPLNHAPVHRLIRVMPDFAPQPQHLAVLTSKYWGSTGVRLSVGFLDTTTTAYRKKVLQHMNEWKRHCNVSFQETRDAHSANVRIARLAGPDGGYWSYLGTDILSIEEGEPTMNLEGFTENTSDAEFRRVVRHETGHTLGFPHEHMRRELVQRIDRDKAIEHFARTQGWTEEEVDRQVLTPIEENSLLGTEKPDPFSIMCYQIPGEITSDGKPIIGGDDIDKEDAVFAGKIYPKPEQAADSHVEEDNSGVTEAIDSEFESAARIEIREDVTIIKISRPRMASNASAD